MTGIELQFFGMCEGCFAADLDLDYYEYSFGRTYVIRCKHEMACTRARSKAQEEMKEAENERAD